MSTLVIAEHTAGRLTDVTLEMITAAVELGEPVAVVVIDPELPAEDLAREGVDEIIHVRAPQRRVRNDVYRAALDQLAIDRQPDAVIAGFTVNAWAGRQPWRPGCARVSPVMSSHCRAKTAG